jgi:hypothetical protein
MRRWVRRLLALDQPSETRFFLVNCVWALFAAALYWVVSQEITGTLLLAGLALAAGLATIRLVLLWRARRREADVERTAGRSIARDPARLDASGGGSASIDRPFDVPVRSVPEPSLGPFAVGLGVSLVAAGVIFGVATVAVGIVPLAWGGLVWLGDAIAEHGDLEWSPHEERPGEAGPGPPLNRRRSHRPR